MKSKYDIIYAYEKEDIERRHWQTLEDAVINYKAHLRHADKYRILVLWDVENQVAIARKRSKRA
jgi:hypothetical protein